MMMPDVGREMTTAALTARDLPRWARDEKDPDLQGIEPDWPVTIMMIETATASTVSIHGSTLMAVDAYETAYRRYGLWALPPAVGIVWEEDLGSKPPTMISGNHRRLAAKRAGVSYIPYLVVHVPEEK